MTRVLPLFLVLGACAGESTWAPETWGEDFLEKGIPAADFADGCEASFDHFYVRVAEASLVDGNDEVVAGIPEALVFDVSAAGPHLMPTVDASSGFYDTVRFGIGPGTASEGNADPAELDGAAIRAVGSVTCGADTVTYDLTFSPETTYDCEPEDLSLVAGEVSSTQLTVHGDHLFYDGLENADAEVRGQAWVDADADMDGVLTAAELQAFPVAPLGYQVGSQGDVADLYAFVEYLVGNLGHIDGEGHCETR